ncbi:taperin [Pseudophryne corroboree]|uniref:taperin n=1 Tax=Pseudophryne corroboree TaxID=495146 RepID=UPI003081C6AA
MSVSGGSTKSWARLEPPPGGKMPAWKLEVLERKRAKMASAAASRAGGKETSPSRRTQSPERLVLQDSLGPLHDNPFIRLEKERRRRRPQQHYPPGRSSSPIRQLLDLYGNVPGIRTIRAENIIIIESDPDYFSQPGAHAADPVEELMSRRGSKVAEIRASEVVIYEPETPRKEPPKKAPEAHRKEPPEHSQVLEEAGRVSRLLEKFDHGKPVRTRSWENLLERDGKPPLLPKPPATAERQGQAPQNRVPKRSGETSPSSASLLDEDSKRFPLNNPSWLPSKQPAVHSLPDPGLFQKRPPSPMASPGPTTPLSPSSPLSPTFYEVTPEEKSLSPIVATVREKFESGHTGNNLPLPKLANVAQKTGGVTMVINPRAGPANKARPPEMTDGGVTRDCPPLTNGHVDPPELNSKAGSSINIQDLLSKSKRPRGTAVKRPSEGSGLVPSSSNDPTSEILKGANTWRPKSEVDHLKSSIPPSASLYEMSVYNHCDQAFTSATPSQQMKVSASTSSNDSFEIKPAPKPDLGSIPDDDIQAKTLANIRLQSKNSFVFIPKKRQVPSVQKNDSLVQTTTIEKPKEKNSASTVNGPKLDCMDSPKNGYWPNDDHASTKLQEVTVNGNGRLERTVSPVTLQASSVPSLSDFDWQSGLLPSNSSTERHSFTDPGAEFEYISSVQQGDDADVLTVPVTNLHEDAAKADIPVTNIDDIVHIEDQEANKKAKPALKVTDSPHRPHASLSSGRSKGGNTFTVVPKRKPVTEQEAFRSPVLDDDDDDEATSKRKSSDGSEAPYSDLGALLKKRYPTVEEIQVIGGYQSLSRSCLIKNGSSRKKMKISFNEQNIHTMFEYPSENSLAEEIGEEEESSGSESEDEDKPAAVFLPRPSFVSGGGASNSLRANSANSGLSNYTPKHSLEYSKWQDEQPQGGLSPTVRCTDSEDMLTPADSSSHTDFRSEPALYF